MNKLVSLIGAPTDIGAGSRGSSMGPEALRVANIGPVLESHGLEVIDRGNLSGPSNPWLPPVDGYRHLDEVVAWNRSVHDAMYAELQLGRLPILLGGDHCLGIGSISAVARHCREQGRKLRVLWLDAHADFNTSQITPSGNIHGMPVACLCGYGPDELTHIGGTMPATTPDVFRQIGIRSVDEGEKRFDLVVRLEQSQRQSADDLANIAITTPAGTAVPLSQLATVGMKLMPNQIQREDAKRRITVGFNIRGRDVESVVEEIQDKVDSEVSFAPGYYITYGGAFEQLQEARQRLSKHSESGAGSCARARRRRRRRGLPPGSPRRRCPSRTRRSGRRRPCRRPRRG